MESGITKEFTPPIAETQNVDNADSADSFQSFIYELFEKNGVLNDLRAYLRGHIVNVIKSAQTGDPHPCQKHFTQRLELKYQAVNILIAEYLMRLEFSYSFSVFVSEIPLANMVFGFAKAMMERRSENKMDMRFKESDIWSILNYLGVQCDSEHAANVVEMYKNDKQNPLLLCILKCMPLYKENVGLPQVSSEDTLSSVQSVESIEKRPQSKPTGLPDKCRHYLFCKTCQNKMYRLKEMYKRKKKYIAKTCKDSANMNPANLASLVNNINAMEKSLIEEMFQQLKCVYETEMEMVKIEEEKKVKRSMASHAIKLQKKRDEMEEKFKARELELERRVAAKKQFLWGLARALRTQHANMARAMRDVKSETHRLELKEDSLKTQLAEAEQILKKRGEEMRLQISNELTVLEGHLESMKKEREGITKEKSELENMKTVQNTPSKVLKDHDMESQEVHSHYDLLKNELAILKKYLESSKLSAKCVIERGTITEPMQFDSQVTVTLNNSQGNDKCSKSDDVDDKVKTNQLVNDFRKKNVNFSQSNLDELYRERSRDRSRSSLSSEAGDNAAPELDLERGRNRDLIQRLREENDRLKAFARQQRSHMEHIERGPVPLQAGARPRTAPPAAVTHIYNSASVNTLNVGWRKGAGEELSIFSNAQPRILVPGDTLPFIGVLRDRHGNARRSPIGSRSARSRVWPLAGVTKRATSPLRDRLILGSPGSSGQHMSGASGSLQQDDDAYNSSPCEHRPRTAMSLEMHRDRDKSPKSVLREAKEKLRSRDSVISSPPVLPRDKSPNAVLREAKQRLRKLEIEAEAVEKSYLDFRRKQSELRLERNARRQQEASDEVAHTLLVVPDVKSKRSQSLKKLDEPSTNEREQPLTDVHKSVRTDFDNYIREYKNKFNIGETHFRSKPTVGEKVKPIPGAYSNSKHSDCKEQSEPQENYLEQPLIEFRKLYTSARHLRREDADTKSNSRSLHSGNTSGTEDSARQEAIKKVKNKKQAELEILKQNLSKMYNLTNDNLDFNILADAPEHENCQEVAQVVEENVLRVEVESTSEQNNLKSKTQDLLLVVQSSVTAHEMTLACGEAAPDDGSPQVTIVVSPAGSRPRLAPAAEAGLAARSPSAGLSSPSPPPSRRRRSISPEQAAHLTRNDVLDAIFHADPDQQISSVQMQLELSKEVLDDSNSDYGKGEYADDFSADVDNYNSRSDYENNSPISLPKTSEDENFWDS
ncbi:uncharacterized protein LOC118271016 isoform X1 [Spodoptera frugiperda]|uniref:Uncharacterized protein LOC118271016 isoform X1 n=1 Tax=Spodoptera frugiperda TaxID=7108 RepID=A0A9R0DQM8_SPOFR|nr:uncharacterized protein LOC118271016 isoform X1 [Spodoptera frugiperda]